MTSRQLDEECRIREKFIEQRLERPIYPTERKDLTDFFHNERADLLACNTCGLLIRKQIEKLPVETYSDDTYDRAAIDKIYPRYLRAFRRKQTPYRGLLRPGARVVEIGSHYGAFLQSAAEWGWKAEGVDVGEDTTRYSRSKGFDVFHGQLEERRSAAKSLDGIFVWNCFEQIEDPQPLLDESRRVLEDDGLLVLRTPNGLFHRLCRRLIEARDLTEEVAIFLEEALGYNNLLGFPYLYGHSADTLTRLVSRHGFKIEGMLNSELLTLPLPEDPDWVEREERAINGEVRMLANSMLADNGGVLTGPWIELWFRRKAS